MNPAYQSCLCLNRPVGRGSHHILIGYGLGLKILPVSVGYMSGLVMPEPYPIR